MANFPFVQLGQNNSPNTFGRMILLSYLCSANRVIMTEQEIFREQAESGYTICLEERCPLKERCLRWKVGQQMPDTRSTCHCVNPRYQDVATERCPLFRNSEKVKFAKGMMHTFTGDMPSRVKPFVCQRIIRKSCRTYYYEFRNGTRLMPPSLQEDVRTFFREAGWNEEIHFDGYVEDYDW